VKRIAIHAAMVALLSTGLASTVSSAAADTVAPMVVENCDHYSGGGNGAIVDGGAVGVRPNGSTASIGAAQLCREGDRFWGYIVFYSPMPAGRWGQVYLQIDRDGQGGPIDQYSCDSAPLGPPDGGNRHVRPGETKCWTPKVHANFSRDFLRVVGARYIGTYPDIRTRDAVGVGAWK
jgi:hypothetical protein